MRTRSLLFAAMMIAQLGTGTVARAHGEAASGPPPSALLARAVIALGLAGSARVHVVLSQTVSGPLPAYTALDLHGRVAWSQPIRARLVGTAALQPTPGSAGVFVPIHLRINGNRVATRAGQLPWFCGSTGSSGSTATGTLAALLPSAQSLLHMGNLTTLGAQTLGVTPVWHVRGSLLVNTPAVAGITVRQPVQVDLYVTRAAGVPKRVVISTSAGAGIEHLTIRLRIDVSGFGQVVRAPLPAQCG